MWRKPLQWLRARFATGAEAEETRRGDGEDPEPGRLYECPDCGTVYISTDPQPCSDCDSDVENVPNERDLGISTNEL